MIFYNNNNNNIHICIAPYGRNFRGAEERPRKKERYAYRTLYAVVDLSKDLFTLDALRVVVLQRDAIHPV